MPDRVTAVLLAFFVLALCAFGGALYVLSRGGDLLAVLLLVLGALSLRALSQVARISDGGAG